MACTKRLVSTCLKLSDGYWIILQQTPCRKLQHRSVPQLLSPKGDLNYEGWPELEGLQYC